MCWGSAAGDSRPGTQAEVTHKVQFFPRHGLQHQQDPYRTLILDYDRETPQCHTDKGEVFSPVQACSILTHRYVK